MRLINSAIFFSILLSLLSRSKRLLPTMKLLLLLLVIAAISIAPTAAFNFSFANILNIIRNLFRSYHGIVEEDVKFVSSHGELTFKTSAKFLGKGPVRVIIHGYIVDIHSSSVTLIRDALKEKNQESNLILVDWERISKNNYGDVKDCVPKVGEVVAKMILHISKTANIPLSDITVIGHSLGAQIAGFAGKYLKGDLDTIIALDPAAPLYSAEEKVSRHLDKSDAKYVYVIHTNGDHLGMHIPVGHVDFYPNGGINQAGCSGIHICSHSRAYQYYAESITSKVGFWARKCKSFDDFGSCEQTANVTMGGENVMRGLEGVYYLETNEEAPFAMGKV